MHGIYLWFFTLLILGFFGPFWREGINHNKCSTSLHLWGRNNNVLYHIWSKFSCEGQNGGNNSVNMMYDYGLDHGELGEHFLVLTIVTPINESSSQQLPQSSSPNSPH